MAVGFNVDFLWYPVGYGEFLHAFFSNVCYHLENGQWGEKYPYFMNKLYEGCLEWNEVQLARKELISIKDGLSEIPPNKVIWDIDDLSEQPPWGNDISDQITDLSNYFVTSDGRDLITMIFKVFDDAESEKHKIEIISL